MAILEKGSSKGREIQNRNLLWNLGVLGANYGGSLMKGVGIDLEMPEQELTQNWAKALNPLVTEFGEFSGGLGMSALSMGMGGGNSVTDQPAQKLKCGGKMKYPDGGIVNPTPNKFVIIPRRTNKTLNGEKLSTMTTVYDTLVGQDYGYWGENLKGVDVPPPLMTDANGKIVYGNPAPSNVMATKKFGGMLTKYNGNTHEMGGIPIDQTNEVENNETSFNMKDGNRYIFSHSIPFMDKKYSFADKSKKIESKYSKRLKIDDKLAKESFTRELQGLAELQEGIKGATANTNKKAFGGLLTDEPYVDDIPFDTNAVMVNLAKKQMELNKKLLPEAYKYENQNGVPFEGSNDLTSLYSRIANPNTLLHPQTVNPMTPKGITIAPTNPKSFLQKASTHDNIYKQPSNNGYQPGYGVPAVGYGLQALANLPMLLAKPDLVNYDRITPEKIDLSSQRSEAKRNRNLAYATSQRNASMLGNRGSAYSNAAVSNIFGDYGDVFNESILREQLQNADYRSKAKSANAEISMREKEANAMEKDAVRSAKYQALNNIGQTAAMAGNTYQQMSQMEDYLMSVAMANPDYTLDFSGGNFFRRSKPTVRRRRS